MVNRQRIFLCFAVAALVLGGAGVFAAAMNGGWEALNFSNNRNNQKDSIRESLTLDPIPSPAPTPIKNIIADPADQLVDHLFNIDSVPSPKGAMFTPDGKEIWITMLLNPKRGAAVFDANTGEKIKDINLSNGGGVEIIFSADGKKAYVSQMETAKVFEIDAETKQVIRVLDTKSAWTKVLELSKDGRKLYASNWSGDDVSEFDLETGALLRRIQTVDTPRGLYATKDGTTLYVAGFGDGHIQKIDLITGQGKIIYHSKGAMRHIAADEDKGVLYISDMGKNAVWKVDMKTDEVSKFADTDMNPNTIALSPDKKVLFVSNRGANFSDTNYSIPGAEWGSVLLFDAETGKMFDAIVGGNQPTALDVSRDGTLMVFSDFLDARLRVFALPSYETFKNGNGGRSDAYKSELKKAR
ncbi:MAG: beta-propeller fold lactonase family protein [Candidatus Wildermuthbacteria bacterium]|nr:beta-propeller fold lactonase family protein [Candidatus Wildermuthbacteria bacterium]